MEFDLSGCRSAGVAAVIIVAVCAVALGMMLILPDGGDGGQDPQAQREYARAERIRAQVEMEAQEQVNFEHSFMLWTTALAAFRNDTLLIIVVVLLALATGYLVADVTRIRRNRD